jgi:alkylhydroperoxidase/carboxymuconolactone decarboxylase family protein YurZ
MPQRKRIQIRCHSILAVDRTAEEPWLDVWLRWKNGPGKVRRAAPTLMGTEDLQRDLEISKLCLSDARANGDAKLIADFEAEIESQEDRLSHLGMDVVLHSDDPERTDGCPDIYMDKALLNRAAAEEMLSHWLHCVHGIANPKFVWRRPYAVVFAM